MTLHTLIPLFVIAVIIIWAFSAYNGLIRLRNQVENAWRQIDVQLKRRHDLIPNLVKTVKGAMEFERETLEKVVEARSKAVGAKGVKEKGLAENFLTAALGRLFALVENYPDLKSNQNILQLQEELTSTENRIGFARQFYNDMVVQFNTRQDVFPTLMIARTLGFKRADYFQAEEAEKAVPSVDISLN
ncbi:MAG: LemA family protein [Thermodesulfobacteriota bacterium]|nr:MAG: LemA family protein [Thermodesulfobacteriota bacterium]